MSNTESDKLVLRLTRIEYASRGVHLFEFRSPDGAELPRFTAGSHVELHLGNGLLRSYSLVNDPEERHRYVLGIKRDASSRGGSIWVHDQLRVGDLLALSQPRNLFALEEDAPLSILVAGGIGVTPLACMAKRLRRLRRPFQLHYAVKQREDAALLDDLRGPELHLHVDAEQGGLLDVAAIVAAAAPDAVLYGCGPAPMLAAFEQACQARVGLRWRVERFGAELPPGTGGAFTVRLARDGRVVPVAQGQSILEALRGVGVHVPASCEQGVCGTCETAVLSGCPEHRDMLLSEQERASNRMMMICCSGSLSDELVLDL